MTHTLTYMKAHKLLLIIKSGIDIVDSGSVLLDIRLVLWYHPPLLYTDKCRSSDPEMLYIKYSDETPQTPTTLSVGKFSKVLEQELPGPKSQQNQGHAGEFQA